MEKISELPQTFKQFQHQFTQHLRHPEKNPRPLKTPSKRMKVYNELVFNGFEDVLSGCFPVLKKILKTKKWEKLIRDFIVEHSCQTPFYRQIPDEFMEYLQKERKENRTDPPCLVSLAHYEWMELVLHLSTEETDQTTIHSDGNLLENLPIFAATATLLSYFYPVHQIGPTFQPKKPANEPFYYLLFRNEEDQVRFIVLNPVSARLVELLLNRGRNERISGKNALEKIAEELKHPDLKVILEEGLKTLNELKMEGAILGVLRK
jgi:uncharacterized protein